jgi:tryptophanyl-tRNA synthetase
VNPNIDPVATPSVPPTQKRVMSGMRPTGRLHLGNYFGALENWVALARTNETFFEVADYHALTTAYERTADIGPDVREAVLDWLAAGIDPERSVVYVQSALPEIAEMHLLLSMIVPVAWLQRVPTFKDQIAALGGEIATYGFLGYPLMQAVDIAIVRADAVPVGRDQVAHLEFGREVVRRFNGLYGPVLVEPGAVLSDFPDVPGTDGRKMSKSYGNAIDIADDERITTKKIRSMLTDPLKVRRHDPGRPEICPVFKLHKIANAARVPGIAEECRSGALGCVDCKSECAERMNARMLPVRERRAAIDPESVAGVLERGAERARETTRDTLARVKSAMRM